jgi:hypothetical protein
MTATPHPLVAKAAADWQGIAARHGVKTTVKPMSSDTYPDGLIIKFETGRSDEHGHTLIFPPREGAYRIRQTLMVGEFRNVRGHIRFKSRDLTRAQFVSRLVEDWARRAARRELVAA